MSTPINLIKAKLETISMVTLIQSIERILSYIITKPEKKFKKYNN